MRSESRGCKKLKSSEGIASLDAKMRQRKICLLHGKGARGYFFLYNSQLTPLKYVEIQRPFIWFFSFCHKSQIKFRKSPLTFTLVPLLQTQMLTILGNLFLESQLPCLKFSRMSAPSLHAR